jgi:predicted phosphodiesterase
LCYHRVLFVNPPMRVLIISDIHANLAALEAVLAAAGPAEAVWCLGDLVGYGPDPNECVERVRDLPNLKCVMGNHDKAVLAEIDIKAFNGDARTAIEWTQSVATPETLAYLRALPEGDEFEEFSLFHGSPRQPVWEYILDRWTAQQNFPCFKTRYCLVGHTHTPVIFRELTGDSVCREERPDYVRARQLNSDRLILNPGSVGQPRDNNPAAAYAFLDTVTRQWKHRRVSYDVAKTQARMRAAHLPDRLAARLALGW